MSDRLLAPDGPPLLGRRSECAVLEEMFAAVRDGEGRSLVVRGEAGVGKTALLDYIVERSTSVRVVRALGVEMEKELPFAALHQLCAPTLDALARLPAPQCAALEIVFGLSAGPPPDRFLVGLAVLTLLSEVATERPLLCVVDDAQWLDQASAQTLAFVARRLSADPVGIVFATRDPGDDLGGLPEIEVRGLRNGDARALLGSAVGFVLDERVRDRIVAETRGNPLALLELPRGLTATQLAGGYGLLGAQTVPGRIEQSFGQRLVTLPEDTRQLLLVAAAEPVGDPVVVWRAAERLGVGGEAAAGAEAEGLLTIRERVAFRHPLARSAVYRSASAQERRAVHMALAEVTDKQVDGDRRAWHLAEAAAGPDESVALELERSADRAQGRGGLAAAAAFLQRAVELTKDPARRGDRALAAAKTNQHAGAFDAALGLLSIAEAGELDERQRADVDLLRAQIAFRSGFGREAPGLLLEAAKRLEGVDVTRARETYLDAWSAAVTGGPLVETGGLLAVSRAIRSASQPVEQPRLCDLLLDGFALLVTDGRAAAAPMLRQAASAFADSELPAAEGLRWGWVAEMAATELWDDARWHAISVRQLALARDVGALDQLPLGLNAAAMLVAWSGDFAGAASLIAEAEIVAEATGSRIARFGTMLLAALRGRDTEALTALIDAAVASATAAGQGVAVQYTQWVTAVLDNGLGRYEEAMVHAQRACDDTPELYISAWALPELIEAATRSGHAQLAVESVERLVVTTQAGGTEWALGIEARSRALVSDGEAAETLYREAIDRLGRSMLRCELARAHLLYGEWLRRRRGRIDARAQLRTAHDMFTAIGMEGFAERARIELVATGEKVRRRSDETRDDLTAQERQIALLAQNGLSNPEIGARLFLSPRTVEWHLRKVFSKLGIRSRRELARVLPNDQPARVRDHT